MKAPPRGVRGYTGYIRLGSSSTVIMNGSVRVTFTPAPSGGAAFDAAGQVSLPDGSAAENGGTQITVNGDGATLAERKARRQ